MGDVIAMNIQIYIYIGIYSSNLLYGLENGEDLSSPMVNGRHLLYLYGRRMRDIIIKIKYGSPL